MASLRNPNRVSFVSIEFNRFLEYYKDSRDINVQASKRKNTSNRSESGEPRRNIAPGKSKRFFLNAGAMDKITKKVLIKTICANAGIRPQKIGPIEIMREFSFFVVDSDVAPKVLKKMTDAIIGNRTVNVEYAERKRKKAKAAGKRKKRKSKKTRSK